MNIFSSTFLICIWWEAPGVNTISVWNTCIWKLYISYHVLQLYTPFQGLGCQQHVLFWSIFLPLTRSPLPLLQLDKRNPRKNITSNNCYLIYFHCIPRLGVSIPTRPWVFDKCIFFTIFRQILNFVHTFSSHHYAFNFFMQFGSMAYPFSRV